MSAASVARALLVPGGLNEALVTRVVNQPLRQQVKPKYESNQIVYALVCEDARADTLEGPRVEKYLRDYLLKSDLDMHSGTLEVVRVDVNLPTIHDHVDRCDIFYMCGGDRIKFEELFNRHPDVMRHLAKQICSGKLLYIGSCGGAIIAGRFYGTTQQEALSVTPGIITVSENEGAIPAHTSTSQTMITLTKKTGVLLHGAKGRAFVRTRSGGA